MNRPFSIITEEQAKHYFPDGKIPSGIVVSEYIHADGEEKSMTSLAKRFVLDHGYVELLEQMGDDWTPASAARESRGQGLKGKEADTTLLKTMLQQGHTSPFEFVRFRFRVKLPIFVARQWIRHRTASVNERSMRLDSGGFEFYIPNRWNTPGGDNEVDTVTRGNLQDYYAKAVGLYESLVTSGVPREQARIVLPVAVYTQWQWSLDLHNLLHFLKLRTAPAAQAEIREYARTIMSILEERIPVIMDIWRGPRCT